MVGCVLSQLKPSELYILSCGKGRGLRPRPFPQLRLLIIRDPHYGRMCFKSVKTLGALHSSLWKRPRPSASVFSTAKNVELLGIYPIRKQLLFSFAQ